ncbi:MAG TPA: methyltransferase domain-containing protein [Phycisphaerae bacterium]|nr:methyltransferase domain-containing protein [Phycisphaerae bacterium]
MPTNAEFFGRFLNPCFVETGSYLGDGIQAALDAGFVRVHSIELSPKYFELCTKRFRNDPRVTVHLGDSSQTLPRVVAGLETPATFWLDGHWSAGDTALGPKSCPLMEELEAIAAHSIKSHTLLIDDMRCWRTEDPTIGFGPREIEAKVQALNPNHRIEYADSTLAPRDILVAKPLVVGTMNEAARRAWLEKTLAAIPAGWRILDAGAGEQQYRKFCGHLKYVSQDFAQYQPAADATGMQMPKWDYGKLDLVCDVTEIPEKDGSFDAIMCTEVFEHISDPVPAMREFSRLLRSGGMLILTAPVSSLTHFAPHYYANGFSRFWYEKHLEAMGFEIVEMTPNGNYFEYLAQEVRRISQVSSRYAGIAPSVEEKAAMRRVLGFLQQASEKGAGSAELLCFGWHVRAVRR